MSKLVDKISKAFIDGKEVLEYWLNGNVHYFGPMNIPTMSLRVEPTVNESGTQIVRMIGKYEDFKHKYRYFDFTPYSASSTEIVGVIFIRTANLGSRSLTINTSGRTFVSFKSILDDGTFAWNTDVGGKYIVNADTKYTFRAVTWYVTETGKKTYIYSKHWTGTFNSGFVEGAN